MIQRCGSVCFLLEPRAAVQVTGDVCREDLQRHLATEPRVTSPIHFAHSASAKRSHNFIGADT